MLENRNGHCIIEPGQRLLKPIPLQSVVGKLGCVEYLRIDAKNRPMPQRLQPVVGSEQFAPTLETRGVYGVLFCPGMKVVADIVIARKDAPWTFNAIKLLARELQIRIDIRAAQRNVSGHDDEIGLCGTQPGQRGLPIVIKKSAACAEVKIGYLNELQCMSPDCCKNADLSPNATG